MALTISQLERDMGPEDFYDPVFVRVLETHLTYLRTHPDTRMTAVNPHDVYKFEGDFYGLLDQHGVPPEYHWVTMRVNDISNPNFVKEDLETLLLPSPGAINKILQLHRTISKK